MPRGTASGVGGAPGTDAAGAWADEAEESAVVPSDDGAPKTGAVGGGSDDDDDDNDDDDDDDDERGVGDDDDDAGDDERGVGDDDDDAGDDERGVGDDDDDAGDDDYESSDFDLDDAWTYDDEEVRLAFKGLRSMVKAGFSDRVITRIIKDQMKFFWQPGNSHAVFVMARWMKKASEDEAFRAQFRADLLA